MSRVVAVTGATGELGGRVARLVAERRPDDVSLRLVVRDSSRAPAIPDAEVVANPGGYPEVDGFAASLDGVHTNTASGRNDNASSRSSNTRTSRSISTLRLSSRCSDSVTT